MMLKVFIGKMYIWLSKLHITKPVVIVMVDGGLCSQMHQFMMGELLKEKGESVEYDLSFFKKGLDLNNNPTRRFLLNILFPHFHFKRASMLKIYLYKLLFRYYGQHPFIEDRQWLYRTAPVLLSGYYSDIPEMYFNGGVFVNLWKINKEVLSLTSRKFLYLIETTQSVGVHVRRGDLATFNSAYGKPVTDNYIKDGIAYLLGKLICPVFYFFSDDIQYVKEELIPSIGIYFDYSIIESDPNKVYEDFILLSYCKALITSKGTMGKYAALYGNAKTIILSADDKQKFIVENLECNKVII